LTFYWESGGVKPREKHAKAATDGDFGLEPPVESGCETNETLSLWALISRCWPGHSAHMVNALPQ